MIKQKKQPIQINLREWKSFQLLPPIIIIGMHRSGTSILSRIFSKLGVQMGEVQDGHNEARCFQTINDYILHINGGSWLKPNPFIRKLSSANFVDNMANQVKRELRTKASSFGRIRPGQPWGWKDPRTSLTLPIWLRLFPEAKVIHIFRSGVNVSLSLKRRAWKQYFLPRRNNIERMFPLGSFIKGYNLWKTYIKCIEVNSKNAKHYYKLRYESLIKNPIIELSVLLDELKLSSSQKIIEEVNGMIHTHYSQKWRERILVNLLFFLNILDETPLLKYGYRKRNI